MRRRFEVEDFLGHSTLLIDVGMLLHVFHWSLHTADAGTEPVGILKSFLGLSLGSALGTQYLNKHSNYLCLQPPASSLQPPASSLPNPP